MCQILFGVLFFIYLYLFSVTTLWNCYSHYLHLHVKLRLREIQ